MAKMTQKWIYFWIAKRVQKHGLREAHVSVRREPKTGPTTTMKVLGLT